MSDPNNSALQRYREIFRLIHQGQLQTAGKACEALVEEYPDFAPAWVAFSELWLHCDEAEKAGAAALRAVELDGQSPETHAQMAKCYMQAGHSGAALTHARRAIDAGPQTAKQFDALGRVLAMAGEHQTALGQFVEAARLAPSSSEVLYGLATTIRRLGLSDQAEQLFEQIVAINPGDAAAHHQLATLRPQTPENNHVERLRAQLDKSRHWRSRALIHQALARELDDLNQPGPAFSHWQAASDLIVQNGDSSLSAEVSRQQVMQEAFSADVMAARAGHGHVSEEPIFILGLPQSGTRLVEKVLAHHPEVTALGRADNFAAVLSAAGAGSAALEHASMLNALGQTNIEALGRRYIESTRPQTGSTQRFIHCLPEYLWLAGLLHLALPAARFILVERDPLDQALALYKTPPGEVPVCAHALADLPGYQRICQGLLEHWRSTLPAHLCMSITLEALTKQPASTVQALVAFCGLASHSACQEVARRAERDLFPVGHAKAYGDDLPAPFHALAGTMGVDGA